VTDIKNPKLLWAKGLLFLLIGLVSSTLLFLEEPSLRVAFLLVLAIWGFCRAYYFAFYVIEHYADPDYRFSAVSTPRPAGSGVPCRRMPPVGTATGSEMVRRAVANSTRKIVRKCWTGAAVTVLENGQVHSSPPGQHHRKAEKLENSAIAQ
jgi:hypothetical protein